MQERIYRDDTAERNQDEYLEVCFKEVYDWNISSPKAIGEILDPLAIHAFGDAHIPFRNALADLPHAIKWATQFGELRIIPISAAELAAIKADVGEKTINYGAKIGNDKPGQFRAYGATLIQCVVLAGIQVLREYSYDILNKDQTTSH